MFKIDGKKMGVDEKLYIIAKFINILIISSKINMINSNLN